MQKAAALSYDYDKDKAPKVVASGKGAIANQIIQKAKEFDIPLFVNAELVNMLVNIEIDDTIPIELYEAVVKVFVWLNTIEKKSEMSS